MSMKWLKLSFSLSALIFLCVIVLYSLFFNVFCTLFMPYGKYEDMLVTTKHIYLLDAGSIGPRITILHRKYPFLQNELIGGHFIHNYNLKEIQVSPSEDIVVITNRSLKNVLFNPPLLPLGVFIAYGLHPNEEVTKAMEMITPKYLATTVLRSEKGRYDIDKYPLGNAYLQAYFWASKSKLCAALTEDTSKTVIDDKSIFICINGKRWNVVDRSILIEKDKYDMRQNRIKELKIFDITKTAYSQKEKVGDRIYLKNSTEMREDKNQAIIINTRFDITNDENKILARVITKGNTIGYAPHIINNGKYLYYLSKDFEITTEGGTDTDIQLEKRLMDYEHRISKINIVKIDKRQLEESD